MDDEPARGRAGAGELVSEVLALDGGRRVSVWVPPLPRCCLVAGTREPWFRENAVRWADALRDAGADVVVAEREGENGGPFWRAELPRMVAWACGRESPSIPWSSRGESCVRWGAAGPVQACEADAEWHTGLRTTHPRPRRSRS